MDAEKLKEIDRADYACYVDHGYLDRVDIRSYVHVKGQLLYAEGGILHVFTEGRHWYLPARFYMWIPPNTVYHLESRSSRIKLYRFFFQKETVESVLYSEPNVYLSNDLLREMFLFSRHWDGGVSLSNAASKYYILKAIKAIIPMLNPTGNLFPIQHPYPKDLRLRSIAAYLNQHIETSYSLEEVASTFGMSSRTLSRMFKENLGLSYVRFLRSLRISKALELMTAHKYSILEIALAVGYTELSSFSNIFYRVTGVRPSIYMAKLESYQMNAEEQDS